MKDDVHTWAASAVRETLRRCVLSLAAGLEREGRRFMAVPATQLEGREQLELAKKLRNQAARKVRR